jgi:hypothetical protein
MELLAILLDHRVNVKMLNVRDTVFRHPLSLQSSCYQLILHMRRE